MRSMDQVGRDQGVLTREEVKFVEQTIVEQIWEQLVGRQLFTLVRLSDAGWKWYKYYEELDMSQASINMEGIAQTDDTPMYYDHEVPIPCITKSFLIQWRDILASRHQGPSLLEQAPRNAARQIAEEEDKLLLVGEYAGWPALGISGLLTSAGASAAASGNWPANAIADINTGRTALENAGFITTEPVLVATPTVVKCLDRILTNTDTTYRQALLDNGLIRRVYVTRNLFAADGGTDSALLVIPGKANFYMVEAQPPRTTFWYDKAGNAYGLVREAIAPVVTRPDSIYEIQSITCA